MLDYIVQLEENAVEAMEAFFKEQEFVAAEGCREAASEVGKKWFGDAIHYSVTDEIVAVVICDRQDAKRLDHWAGFEYIESSTVFGPFTLYVEENTGKDAENFDSERLAGLLKKYLGKS